MSELDRKWLSLDGFHSWQNGQMIHILFPNFKLEQVSFISSDFDHINASMTTVSSGHWNCVIIHTTALIMTKPEYLYIIIVLKLMYIRFRYTTKMPM